LRQDTVAEIEDQRAGGEFFQHVIHFAVERRAANYLLSYPTERRRM
jgi:hypothetical protein